MAISSISGMGMKADQLQISPATDMYTKNIQQQIIDTQKKMQDISSNEKMSMEEKMKKRQELQQEISDLNNQLRQHLAEKKKEQQEQKKAATVEEDTRGADTTVQEGTTGISGKGMSAMISAGTSLKQAQSQDSVKVKLEGRAGVLRAEIKQDARMETRQDAPQGSANAKERELEKVEKKVSDVSSAQMSSLKDANQVMKDAARAELSDEKPGKTGQDKNEKEVWLISDSQKKGMRISGLGQVAKDSNAADSMIKRKTVNYVSVDIRG